MNITPILATDIIEIIKKKDIINSFSYKISVPSDQILKTLGLSEDEFDKFRNLNFAEVAIVIGGGRNKDIFNDKEFLRDLVEKIPVHLKKGEKNLLFKAKNENESLADYRYIDNKVVRKIEFEYQTTDNSAARKNEIKDKLYDTYIQNRSNLLQFIRE